MTRRRTVSLAAVLLAVGAVCEPAAATPLTITRNIRTVPQPGDIALQRLLPGTTVDYEITATNELNLGLTSVNGSTITETVSAKVLILLKPLGSNGSPVALEEATLLNGVLLASGAELSFISLASTTDGLDFSNGTGWGYVPIPNADGYDPALRAIRIKVGGTHLPGRAFRLRYRAVIP